MGNRENQTKHLLPCCDHEDLDHQITGTKQGCLRCDCQDRGPWFEEILRAVMRTVDDLSEDERAALEQRIQELRGE